MLTTTLSAPAKMAASTVVVESSLIFTISPPRVVVPADSAVNVIVATVSSPLDPHPDDGERPHDPTTSTSFTGSLVVHSKLLDQLLPITQSASDVTFTTDASNVTMTWNAVTSLLFEPCTRSGTSNRSPARTVPKGAPVVAPRSTS